MPTVEELRSLLWLEFVEREQAATARAAQLHREVWNCAQSAISMLGVLFLVSGLWPVLGDVQIVGVLVGCLAVLRLAWRLYRGVRISRTTLAQTTAELQLYAQERVWRGY